MSTLGPSDERGQGEHLLRLGQFDAMTQREVQDISVIPLKFSDTHEVIRYITQDREINCAAGIVRRSVVGAKRAGPERASE